jgi:hypothetical protein
MASFTSNTQNIDLSSISVDIEDSSFLSTYFNITEFNSTLGAGKNLLIVNTTNLLSSNPNIKIQALDGNGTPLFIDSAIINNSVSGKQAYYYSLYVDDSLVSGAGKLVIVGLTADNKVVRWTANIVISTTTETTSKIVFVNKPQLSVIPIITNALSTFVDINPKTISGSLFSNAINPPKDFDITNDYNKNKLDYRLVDSNASFSKALVNFPITLNVTAIKGFGSSITQYVTASTSVLVGDVINNTTLKLADPFIYQNNKILEIVAGTYTCSYNNVNYSSASFFTSSYATQSTDLANGYRYVKNSYALIGYTNLNTFSGKIQRHKIYKKDLSTAGGFELVTDELFSKYEMLTDITTPNKTFENLGTFYSQFHINNFWFTSSNAFSLQYDTKTFVDAMVISASSPITGGYIITKPNSSFTDRNSTYIPYDAAQSINFSGSAFDSNFLHFHPNTSYNISFNAAFLNKLLSSTATLDFYITSSNPSAANEMGFVAGKGIKIGSLSFADNATSKLYDDLQSFDFSFLNETYGALVIYPNNFNIALLANLSIHPSEKYGFSQGTYFSKFPFDVTKPNDIFEIKSELYDKDGVLAYDDLDTVQYFDPSGSTSPVTLKIGTSIIVENISASSLTVTGNSILSGAVSGITQLTAIGVTSSLYGTASWANNAISTSYLIYPNYSTASFAITASYAMNGGGSGGLITGATYPITSSWALTASYSLNGGSGSSLITGATYPITSSWSNNLNLKNAVLFDYSSSNTTTTNTIIIQQNTGSYNSAFFDYVIVSASNFRAGTLLCAFSGSNLTYTEYATTDYGNTSPITMSALLSNFNIQLQASSPIGQNWYIKAFGRYL